MHSQSQHEGLARSRNDPGRDIIPNRSQEQRFRRNSNNIQSRPDPSANVRLRPNSGSSRTSYQRQTSDQPQRPRSTSYDHSNPPLYDRNLVEYSGRPQSMMLGAGDMMEESYDEAGIRPRYNGPEKGRHLNIIFFLLKELELKKVLKNSSITQLLKETYFSCNRCFEYQYYWWS